MVNLEKGGKVLLEKTNESGNPLNVIRVGLGWDTKPGSVSGDNFDLDASIVCLGADGKAVVGGFCFFNALNILNGAVVHSGDNLTGEGDGDDEVISIDLSKLPTEVEKMLVVVNIFQAASRNQNFGIVENSFCRLLNGDNNDEELIHFDLNFDASTATGVKFATIFKRNGEWAFSADQTEFEGGLDAIVQEYGVRN